MPDLTPVPDLDPAEHFTTIGVCPTCPPGSLGFATAKTAQDWEVTHWHQEPCPQTGETPVLTRVPGCPACHDWSHSDLSVSSLIPGKWAFIPHHGKTPLTTRDGTTETATGGEYACPQMKIDHAVIERMGMQQSEG